MLATVKGDVHDIGKNMVEWFLAAIISDSFGPTFLTQAPFLFKVKALTGDASLGGEGRVELWMIEVVFFFFTCFEFSAFEHTFSNEVILVII